VPIDYGDFWQQVFGDYWDEDVSDSQKLRGFIGGALKEWWRIKAQPGF
jgi:hypothetical protein